MSTFTATASLKYWAGSAAAVSGEARSGYYNGTPYSGSMIFSVASLGDMSNVNINNVTLKLTIGSLGGAYTKDIIVTHSGRSVTVGTYSKAGCRSTTVTLSWSSGTAFNSLKTYFEGLTGGKAYLGVISHGSSRGSGGQAYDYDYLNITKAELTLTYGQKKSDGSISAAQTGSAATLKITSYNSSYTHKLTWTLGSNSATTTAAAGATSASYTIPHSWLPSATSGTASVTLETLSGSTSLGSNTYSFTVSVPTSVVPSIGTFTATPSYSSAVSSTAQGWGLYIQGLTKATVAMGSVSAGSGASISSYSITSSPNYGSGTTSSLTSGWLTGTGNVVFTAKVTDSRGRTASKTVTVNVQAYAPPKITAASVARCTSTGTTAETDGTYAKFTVTYSCSSIVSGSTQKNNITATGTVHQCVLNGVTKSDIASGTQFIMGGGNLNTDTAYTATITLKDLVGGQTVYTLTVPSAAYIMHIRKGGKSMGIGKAAPNTNNKLDIGWATDVDGLLTAKNSAVIKEAAYLHSSGNPAIYFQNEARTKTIAGLYVIGSNNQLLLRSYRTTDTSNYENFWFPIPEATGSNVGYSVLTTKSPVSIAQGGTGANSISAALNSLAVSMYFNEDYSTLASIYPKLTTIPSGYSGMVWLHPTPARLLSNNAISASTYVSGIVARTSSTGFRLFMLTDKGVTYIWTITGWTDASTTPTIGNVYTNAYSTTEQIVGVWTDGKPIYRTVFTESKSGSGNIKIGTLPRKPDTLIYAGGSYLNASGDQWRTIPFYNGANYFTSVYLTGTDNKDVYVSFGSSMSDTKSIKLIVEYTA